MTEDDLIEFVTSLPSVVAATANATNEAPEGLWGDSFFFYDPEGDLPADRRFPFVTIVTRGGISRNSTGVVT